MILHILRVDLGRDPLPVIPPRMRAASLPALSAEVADADLGDGRLTQRLGLLIDSLADRPGESFPKALSDAELEGRIGSSATRRSRRRRSLRRTFGRPCFVRLVVAMCSSYTTRPSSSSEASRNAKGSDG
jgi:hypothetical protein